MITASKWQVRQKMHAASAGRWRHYEQHLGPLLPLASWHPSSLSGRALADPRREQPRLIERVAHARAHRSRLIQPSASTLSGSAIM